MNLRFAYAWIWPWTRMVTLVSSNATLSAFLRPNFRLAPGALELKLLLEQLK